MLPGMERDSDKGTYAFDEPSTVWWWQNATKENQPYIVPSESAPSTTSSTWSAPPTETLLDDIEYCRSVVERCGLEMLFLDQTRGDVGMPVVKVIVPGLRHFWARYAPGRLYSVPVELGRLARPLAEAELNPIDMFI
jgi:ribosomal protein S12 methylthiotransferase accessory factor